MRVLLALWFAAALAFAAMAVTQRSRCSVEPAPQRSDGISLLALGDTGKRPRWPTIFDGQIVVADALACEAKRHPVDALVLLGDNFYFEGLDPGSLVERVRENVVRPYCYFLMLAGSRSREVEDACDVAPELRRPVPLFAVLGNHDHGFPQSAALEASAIPALVSNWTLPAEPVRSVELAAGVTLILVDSTTLEASGDARPLRDALRRSRGPWRTIVAHHPVGTSRDADDSDGGAIGSWGRLVDDAIAGAAVPVQIFLAGHEHNLQIIDLPGRPGPALVVVAGGGSSTRVARSTRRARRFLANSLGFARVDLLREPIPERAVVTLFRASRWRWLLGLPAEAVARWSVDETGVARAEPLANGADGPGAA